jgi:predicted transcriptional regulator
MKRTLNERQKGAIEVMSKPKTPSEITEQIGLTRANNISFTLKELLGLELIYCLNPKANVGRLYGLTKKGQKFRRRLFAESGTVISYTEPLMNWNLYGWVVCGRQKKAILKVMKMAMPLKYIKERAQEYNPRISRMNANDVLQLFVKKGIARKIRKGDRVLFTLTKTGEALRNQLIEP